MGQRFSDIRRAAKLSQQLQGYVSYLSNPRSLTRPYQARGPRTNAMLVPFGGGVPTGTQVATSFENKPENVTLVTAVNAVAGAQITAPRTGTVVTLVGFRPARVTRLLAATKVTTQPTSKYTNVEYRKYTTDRGSVPFGADGSTDEQLEVFALMKSELVVPGQAICWISFSPENKKFR